MKVVGLTDKAEEILKITKLYQVFQEFQDETSALQSFPHAGKSKPALEIMGLTKIRAVKEEKQLRFGLTASGVCPRSG